MKILSLFVVALMVSVIAMGSARADSYLWLENNNLASTLTGTPGFSTLGNTATVTYTGQTFTNTGAPVSDAGMYLAWVWAATTPASRAADYAGYTPMPWDNARQAFYNDNFGGLGDVSMQVQSNLPVTFLSLATVGDPTGTNPGWTGTPWAFDPSAPPITTHAAMNVPFIDFGTMGTNQVKTYDITFVYTFSSPAGVSSFNDFYVGGQGVAAAVPAPAAAWGGVALLGVLAVKRWMSRKRSV